MSCRTSFAVAVSAILLLVGLATPALASAPVSLASVASLPQGASDYAMADLDGDGALDIAYVTGAADVRLIFSSTPGYETSQTLSAPHVSSAGRVAAGDFDGDGDTDLAVVNADGGSYDVFANNGDGTFAEPVEGWGLQGSPVTAAVAMHVSGAGDDLAVAAGDGQISIMQNPLGATPLMRTLLVVGHHPDGLSVSDVNHDGCDDLFARCSGVDSALLLSDGHGGWTASALPGGALTGLDIADFNADGQTDIATVADGSGDLNIWSGSADGSFTLSRNLGTGYGDVFAGDLNGDGLADVGAFDPWAFYVFRGRGAAGFRSAPDVSSKSIAMGRVKLGIGTGALAANLAMSPSGLIWAPVAVAADSVAPTTTVSPMFAAPGGINWISALSFAPTDDGWGVARTMWWEGANPATQAVAPAALVQGVHTIHYFSVDEAGNREATASIDVHVDLGLPSCTSNAKKSYTGFTTVKLSATDALSGVDSTWYSLDGAPPVTGTTVAVRTAGSHKLIYWATDHAGNVGAHRTASFSVARASVGDPSAPKSGSHSKAVPVNGYLRPRHAAGTYPVWIYRWKKTGDGTWAAHGYVKAKASNHSTYTKYAASVKLSSKGTWKLQAYAPADSGHAAAWSKGYAYVRVK